MSHWFPWLEWSLFLLVTVACEVPIFMTRFALKLLGWTLETCNVIWISTLLTSLLVPVNILGIKALLVLALPVSCIILVTGWSRLHKVFSLLVFACWEVCTLMPHQIDVSHLGVTCHLLDVPGSHLCTLHLLCKLPDLACGKLVQVYVAVINCLGDKFLIFQAKPKGVPVKELCCFWGVLSQSNLSLYCIVPFINWLVSLLEACKQVKSSPDCNWLGLAKFFKSLPNGIKHEFICGQVPRNILVHTKITNPCNHFLALPLFW